MILARLVFRRLALRAQSVDKHLGQAFYYLISLPPEKTQNREADGEIATYISPAFYKHDFQPFTGRSPCCHNSGRASADNQNIYLIFHRNVSCRLLDKSYHILIINNRSCQHTADKLLI